MSSPSYAAVLRAPHARRTFGAALLGRLSYGVVSLSLTLASAGATGSYATAGAAVALFGLAVSVLSPVRARLIDRYGPRRALPSMAVAYAVLLAALALVTARRGVPAAPVVVLAFAAGAFPPPLGPVMRTLWSDLLPDRRLLQRAFSLDTVAEELLFVAGPLLAGLIAALARPAAGLAVSAGLVLSGTFALVSSPVARSRSGPGDEAAGPETDGLAPPRPGGFFGGLGRPVVLSAGVGACLGALGLLVVAFASRRDDAAAAAWAEAALSVGSAIGGLAYGALSWRVSGRVRLPLLTAAVAVPLAAAGSAPGLYVLSAVVGAAGLFVAPAMTTAYLLAEESADHGGRTRAGAWVNTAFNAGSSFGAAMAGQLVGRLPLACCFVAAAAPALLPALAALARRDRPTRL
ncbi:MFS transporter [Actinoallomurus purpureus]|uniref:MFS transporter n=1 Tax=Actinoallomurus purpureus TaxID=478114 RepID=UPI00209232DD|nr:MFS transporter [Actinoallomurus purpureus]MCO6010717.1 MFS transporter [Actinoallomurus purpureus]